MLYGVLGFERRLLLGPNSPRTTALPKIPTERGFVPIPRLFTKLLKPVLGHLRAQCGISCTGYIDDALYLGETVQECMTNIHTAVQLFISLGFHIHPKKSVIVHPSLLNTWGLCYPPSP